MGMEISKSFVVDAPADAVWAFLIDPYRVAKCLPGAALTEKIDDATYAGTITVKVGPVTASYRGKMKFERLDPDAREAELSASGQETKGKGGADMRMKSKVTALDAGKTEVSVTSDVNVVGVLAQFGRGMIQDVSDQMFGKFSDAMRRDLEGAAPATPATPAAPAAVPQPAAPDAPAASPAAAAPAPAPAPPGPSLPPQENVLDVGAIGAQAAGRAALRMLARPGFWIAVVLFLLLVFWLSRP